MDMELFDKTLDTWADEAAAKAEKARKDGDEYGISLGLMCESMYRTMLRTFGHVNPAGLAAASETMTRRAEAHAKNGDKDFADRCILQRECIERTRELIRSLGGNA